MVYHIHYLYAAVFILIILLVLVRVVDICRCVLTVRVNIRSLDDPWWFMPTRTTLARVVTNYPALPGNAPLLLIDSPSWCNPVTFDNLTHLLPFTRYYYHPPFLIIINYSNAGGRIACGEIKLVAWLNQGNEQAHEELDNTTNSSKHSHSKLWYNVLYQSTKPPSSLRFVFVCILCIE